MALEISSKFYKVFFVNEVTASKTPILLLACAALIAGPAFAAPVVERIPSNRSGLDRFALGRGNLTSEPGGASQTNKLALPWTPDIAATSIGNSELGLAETFDPNVSQVVIPFPGKFRVPLTEAESAATTEAISTPETQQGRTSPPRSVPKTASNGRSVWYATKTSKPSESAVRVKDPAKPEMMGSAWNALFDGRVSNYMDMPWLGLNLTQAEKAATIAGALADSEMTIAKVAQRYRTDEGEVRALLNFRGTKKASLPSVIPLEISQPLLSQAEAIAFKSDLTSATKKSKKQGAPEISHYQAQILSLLDYDYLSSAQVARQLGIDQETAVEALNLQVALGHITPHGKGRFRVYSCLKEIPERPAIRRYKNAILMYLKAERYLTSTKIGKRLGLKKQAVVRIMAVLVNAKEVDVDERGPDTFYFLPGEPPENYYVRIYRDRIVNLLRIHGKMNMTEVANKIGKHPDVARKALKALEEAGHIQSTWITRSKYYFVVPETIPYLEIVDRSVHPVMPRHAYQDRQNAASDLYH